LRTVATRQQLRGLHGHIHESKGAKKIVRTLRLSPGSRYNSGDIDGVLVVPEDGTSKRWPFEMG
jgi:Icc-related predicted phosphoesterase